MYKHEASWGREFVDSQTRWDVYLQLTPDCFPPVKPHWPIQHTLNPARSVLKTCQLHFQTMPVTSALHMCVHLTGSGLNYLSGFNWMSSPYSSVWEIFVVYMQACGAQHRQQSLSEICKFSMLTCQCLHSPDAAANQPHHKNIKLNAKNAQNFIAWIETPRHREKHRESISKLNIVHDYHRPVSEALIWGSADQGLVMNASRICV